MKVERRTMTKDDEPKTDAELIERLTVLYAAGDHSDGARDDFWDSVNFHIGWILELAKAGAKARAERLEGALVALEKAVSGERSLDYVKIHGPGVDALDRREPEALASVKHVAKGLRKIAEKTPQKSASIKTAEGTER